MSNLLKRSVPKRGRRCYGCGKRPAAGRKLFQYGRLVEGGLFGEPYVKWETRTLPDAPDYPFPVLFCGARCRARYLRPCRCRPAKRSRDCFYCGSGYEPNLCGSCREAGIDGKTIRGTAAVVCAEHRPVL